MRFAIYTLIDITNSKTTDPKRRLPYSQAQNLNTILQLIDMRAQPLDWRVTHVDKDITGEQFGFVGKHTVWCVEITIEHEIELQIFANDIYGVPYISRLCETFEANVAVFDQTNTYLDHIS